MEQLTRRGKAFLFVNGLVVSVGLAVDRLEQRWASKWLLRWALHDARMLAFVLVVSHSASKKETIGKRDKAPKRSDFPMLVGRLFVAGLVDLATTLACQRRLRPGLHQRRSEIHGHFTSVSGFVRWFAGFVAKSFAFEVVFDFFHYWTHRLFHESAGLYRFHKLHHKYLHPCALSTFQQDPLDLLCTNFAPVVCAMLVLPRSLLSRFEFNVLMSYRVFVEVAGHAGVETNATSFPQFPLLPKLLGIAMRTNDHDLHHSLPNKPCNYSKRFVLWDKAFGTYRDFRTEGR